MELNEAEGNTGRRCLLADGNEISIWKGKWEENHFKDIKYI